MPLDLSDPLCTIPPSWMRFLRAVDGRSRSSTDRPELSTVPATELAAGVQRVLADQIASGRLRPNERINQERRGQRARRLAHAGARGAALAGARRAGAAGGAARRVRRAVRRAATSTRSTSCASCSSRTPRAVACAVAPRAPTWPGCAACATAWSAPGGPTAAAAFALNRTFHERALRAVPEPAADEPARRRSGRSRRRCASSRYAKEADAALEERTNAEHRTIVEAYAARDARAAESSCGSHIVEAHEATARFWPAVRPATTEEVALACAASPESCWASRARVGESLVRMCEAMRHRGADSTGFALYGEQRVRPGVIARAAASPTPRAGARGSTPSVIASVRELGGDLHAEIPAVDDGRGRGRPLPAPRARCTGEARPRCAHSRRRGGVEIQSLGHSPRDRQGPRRRRPRSTRATASPPFRGTPRPRPRAAGDRVDRSPSPTATRSGPSRSTTSRSSTTASSRTTTRPRRHADRRRATASTPATTPS